MQEGFVVQMEKINKRFPGVNALEDVDLNVKYGETLALMGENGAGKSTLMKVLTGLYKADSGKLVIDGNVVTDYSINRAIESGISMIYQELSPVKNLTVAENIFLGREPFKVKNILLDYNKLFQNTEQLLKKLNINEVSAADSMMNLTVAKMQMVEIAKAVSYNSKVIIMDEPTSSISEEECNKLFNIINDLKEKHNISFIFISHKLDEVYKIADRIVVLRDGKSIGTWNINELSQNDLIKYMVGREITQLYPKQDAEIGDIKLSVKNLNVKGLLKNISFDLHQGEILGFSGLIGAGRTELAETLFGLHKIDSGTIQIDGKDVIIKTPKDALKQGIAYLTEDRRSTGCFLNQNIRENLMAPNWKMSKKGGKIDYGTVSKLCGSAVKDFAIKTPSLNTLIESLSGGNQQKVLVARWLMGLPSIIIVDEPTRGIDVGSKSEIHRLFSQLAQQGHSIIMISSELPEVMGMSDRIAIMHEGTITGILDRHEADQETILSYASGLLNQYE